MPYILIIIAVLALWLVGGYNGLVKLRQMVNEAFSGMDVYMKKRYDLIPNLVNTVKGYATHEKETLEAVVNARAAAAGTSSDDPTAKLAAEQNLNSALGRLMVIAEQYPNLKADAQFLDLQKQLQAVENDIAEARNYYNGASRQYNTKCEVFPTVFIANTMGFKKVPYFELEDAAERQTVTVDFSK